MVKIPLAFAGLSALFATAAWSTSTGSLADTMPIPAPASADAEEFQVDPVHSSVVFRVIHLGAAPFWGRFNSVDGNFRFDPENPDASFVNVEIAADSVDTNNPRRDGHLKSPDFFNAAEHPKLTFKSSKVEPLDDDRYRVTGVLEIRGNAKEMAIEVKHFGTRDAGERFGLRSGYEARFAIDRTEFDVNYGADSGALGKQVELVIALEGMKGE